MKSCALAGLGFQALVGAWIAVSSISACGGEASGEPKTADAAAAPAAPSPAVDEPAPAPEPEPEPEPKPEPAAAPAPDPNAPRQVKYVVTPEGLKIELSGVRFLAVAEAKQVGQGWGAKVTVKAEVLDGKEHVLLSPKRGPIAFAAAVFKKDSTDAERVADQREGEGELKLGPAAPTTFSRAFPEPGGRVLGKGETLDLEVALWGLGETAADRRPVKQFFHVKMKVDKGKPKAIVEPPASAAQ